MTKPNPPKTTVIFSDLHLCDNSNANDFHHKEEFLAFLDYYRDPERFILIGAGDIFDVLQANPTRILFYNHEIINFMHNLKNLTLLTGNHDWILSYFIPPWRQTKHLRVEHGHHWDIYNNKPSKIGYLIARIVSWGERLIHKDTDEWFMDIVESTRHITPASKNYPGDYREYQIAANAILHIEQKKVCVFGHTHKAGIWKLQHGIYANAGCWTGHAPPTYITVDNNFVTLHTITDGKIENGKIRVNIH